MASRRSAAGRLEEQVARICARAQQPLDLLAGVAAAIRPVIPYRVAGWLLTDPDTLLLTGVYNEGVSRAEHLALIQLELEVDDLNKFVDLAHRGVAAASLSQASGGELERSARWRTVYRPQGYGDELRGVFTSGSAVWGDVCLARSAEDEWFSEAEVASLARLCPHIGNGIRACLLLAGSTEPERGDGPAVAILTDDGVIESITAQVTEWFGSLQDDSLESLIVVHEVARRAQVLARSGVGEPAMARTRSRGGQWLVVRAVCLDPDGSARTAVILEPAQRADLAPVLVELHRLTRREKEVTQLLLTGMSTREIADRLWITSETLRGHIKAVFGKLGVTSRPELAAALSREPAVRS